MEFDRYSPYADICGLQAMLDAAKGLDIPNGVAAVAVINCSGCILRLQTRTIGQFFDDANHTPTPYLATYGNNYFGEVMSMVAAKLPPEKPKGQHYRQHEYPRKVDGNTTARYGLIFIAAFAGKGSMENVDRVSRAGIDAINKLLSIPSASWQIVGEVIDALVHPDGSRHTLAETICLVLQLLSSS